MKKFLSSIVLASTVGLWIGCGDQATRPSALSGVSERAGDDLSVTGQSAELRGGRNFVAPLSGREEVPPVDTKGTGAAKFQLSKDGGELSYKLNVANIENVTQAHIHIAPAGVNGPVVAFLFGFVPGGVTVNGTLAQGVLTDSDLVGPLAGETLEELLEEMNDGNTYVNVHTVVNPAGEIRGQIK